MARLKRPELASEARRINLEQLAGLGAEVRASRRRRHLNQAAVAGRAGSSNRLAGSNGAGRKPLARCVAARLPGGRTAPSGELAGRDALAGPADAGHLAIQELVMRLGREAGTDARLRAADAAARPEAIGRRRPPRRPLAAAPPRRVLEHDRRHRRRGAFHGPQARRGTRPRCRRRGSGRPRGGRVGRRGRRRANRSLVARYPEMFSARFPASRRWVEALTTGAEPPTDARPSCGATPATRLFAWRRGR